MKSLSGQPIFVAVLVSVALVVGGIIAGLHTPTSAASSPLEAQGNPFAPRYQAAVTCTLSVTTTDSLEVLGIYNDKPDQAFSATPPGRSGLALAPGNRGQHVTAKDDWFRLDNTTPGATYQIEAIPEATNNYNLGLIIYDSSLTAIITDSNPTDNYQAQASLVASGIGPYYFKVFQIPSTACSGRTYKLNLTITAPGTDPYEPNDTKADAYIFPVTTSASATKANFVPPGTDQDWFAFYVKSGRYYRAYTTNLSGVDTYLEVFTENMQRIAADNDGGGGFASKVEWQATYNGYYYIRVTNMVDTSKPGDTYDLIISEVSTATATPGAAPSSPSADRCDHTELGNYDFDHACVIAANRSEDFNFVPPPYGGPDNDFFKMWVKPGLLYECKTSDLSPGVDPNMIIYDHNRNAIAGNDDVEPGNLNSRLAYYARYEGWLYILIGYGNRTPPSIADTKYTLLCEVTVSGAATATPAPAPTATPQSVAQPTSVPPAPPTPVPQAGLSVRTLTTPTPVPAVTPAPRFVPIKIIVYYDANGDGQPGAGEGIGGLSVLAYEAATNKLLAQGFTNELGSLEFTVAAQGPVQVKVPFLGFSQLAGIEGADIHLRVPPTPGSPGGTP